MSWIARKPIALAAIAAAPTVIDEVADRMRFLVVEASALDRPFEGTLATLRGIDKAVAAPARTAAVVFAFEATARTVLGRSATKADIVLHDGRISGVHAAIAPGDGVVFWLIDLASSNGTFLEGRCLAPGEAGRAALRVGATFMLDRVEIRFVDAALLRSVAAAAG